MRLVAAMKKPTEPTLTSEFPLEQAYRPEPAQLEVLPVAARKAEEKPKFKVHFCTNCKKPFKIQLPIQPGETILCPWCDNKNTLGETVSIPATGAPSGPPPSAVAKPITSSAQPAVAKPVEPRPDSK